MKICRLLLLTTLWLVLPGKRILGQSAEISQLILNVEKLTQMKKILSQMKQTYSVLNKGYGMIRDLSKGNFDLHRIFLQGLFEASPSVRRYHKVKLVIDLQLQVVSLTKRFIQRFRNSGLFSLEELQYLSLVQEKALEESLMILQELIVLVVDGKLKMNDGERLLAIDVLYSKMERSVEYLRTMVNSTDILRYQRMRESRDIDRMEEMTQKVPD
ncbi:TerB family tellurite resistance protein [Sphingobacterium cellulitidis]|uniref:TerB family tellurite resistance protein n=1 Tax=Sphingobacterium cellulitidis TaxID=1768011 RepID=UPI00370D8595